MSFSYVSGNPALDLTGTVLSRRDQPVDLLAETTDLERWVAACDELPADVTADPATFQRALTLREAVYQLAQDRMLDRPFDSRSLRIVNHMAAERTPLIALTNAGSHISGDLLAALAHVARTGIAVLGDPEAPLKECDRPDCTRIYLDRSRGARRAWCGMEECGNRVKAAAYRARRRAPTPRGAAEGTTSASRSRPASQEAAGGDTRLSSSFPT